VKKKETAGSARDPAVGWEWWLLGGELLEAEADVEGEAVVEEAGGFDDGFFVGDAEIDVFHDAEAEADSDGGLGDAGGVGAAEVEEVVAFGVEGDVVAAIDDGPAVGEDEGDEPVAEEVVDLEGVVEGGALGGAVVGKAKAGVAGDVEVAEAFGGGEEEVPFAIAAAVEDVFVARRDDESDAGGEDELVGFIVDEGVFDAKTEISPAAEAFAKVGFDFDVTALIEEDAEAVGDGVADLDAGGVGDTRAGDETAVDVMEGVDGTDFSADDGILEVHEVGDGRDGVLFPASSLDGGCGGGFGEGGASARLEGGGEEGEDQGKSGLQEGDGRDDFHGCTSEQLKLY
jgi:hypothetical protein